MKMKFDLASEDRLGSVAFLFDIGFSSLHQAWCLVPVSEGWYEIWDMRKWDEPLEPNTALCHSSQSPSSFQAYELAAKYTTVVNIYIFWHFQFSSPAISCECCNGWAAASRLGEACGKTELLISARTPLWMQLIEQFLQEMVRPRDPLLGMGYVNTFCHN